MNEEIKVVIIGGIHHNTLGVIRSLTEKMMITMQAKRRKLLLVFTD